MTQRFIMTRIIVIVILVLIYSNEIEARVITTSSYEINFELNRPDRLESEIIRLDLLNNDNPLSQGEYIYIREFQLINDEGKTISSRYITLETPFYQGTLDKQYQYLIFKPDQENSWLKIGILPDAVFVSPGIYKGIIDIPDVEWEIQINVEVKPYVSIDILDNAITLDIARPEIGNFHYTSEPCKVKIESNYDNWEVGIRLASGCLISETGDKIMQGQVFLSRDIPFDEAGSFLDDPAESFINIHETGGNTLLHGSNYKKEFLDIYVGVELGKKWSDQPAGKYSGNIIFTLRGTSDKED
ncbi:MAG: hypothetical protein ACLFPF_03825 [Halanaerobiales bacterium]